MAQARRNQPSYNFITGEPTSPPQQNDALRKTMRSSTMTRADSGTEDLRARIKTLEYELSTLKQDRELEVLQHETAVSEANARAEADHRRAQAAEASAAAALAKAEAAAKESQGGRNVLQDERTDLEKKLRRAEGQRQALQEELDGVQEQFDDLQRTSRRHESDSEARLSKISRELEQAKEEAESKEALLHASQQRLAERERQNDELESQLVVLKGHGSNAQEAEVLRKELADQVSHIRKLETTNRSQLAELQEFRNQKKNIDVVQEEKRTLETKLRLMNELRNELAEVKLRNDVLEDEKKSWSTYLEDQSGGDEDIKFESPEDMAQAFMRIRVENISLLDRIGTIEPEINVKDEEIRMLQDKSTTLLQQLEEAKSSTSATANTETTSNAKLERQKKLAIKETEYLRAQLKLLDSEESEMHPERYSESQIKRITELEGLIDEYRKELETSASEKAAASAEPKTPSQTLPFGNKRPLDDASDERIGELLRKNKQLQQSMNDMKTKTKVLESELKAKSSQLSSFKSSSRYRILELRSNPTSAAASIKQETLDTLRAENEALQQQVAQKLPTAGSTTDQRLIPRASLKKLELEMQDRDTTIASRDKSLLRLRDVFRAKGLEFREAVFSLLGWQLNFQQNGKVKASSMYYPSGKKQKGSDDSAEEHFIEFDGENGTMKVSGGPQSEYAKEIRGLIEFWVDGKGQVPCFLAAMTLEFFEKYGDAGDGR